VVEYRKIKTQKTYIFVNLKLKGFFKMDTLKKFFPNAFKATELKAFIIALVIYALIDIICGFVIGILAKIPLVGILFSILGAVVGLYALIGIVLSILVFVKVIK
jgi:hypothetical protein